LRRFGQVRRSRAVSVRHIGLWKALGLAGIAGVAATGAVIARAERRRQALTPQDVRDRLHARHETAVAAATAGEPTATPATTAAPAQPPFWRRLSPVRIKGRLARR
jgi:hypothetical protein